jgi:hypothetical protein
MKLEYQELQNILLNKESGISQIVVPDYLSGIDLTCFTTDRSVIPGFIRRNKDTKINKLFSVKDSSEILNNNNNKQGYIRALLDPDKKIFLNPKYFNYRDDRSRIATSDFRVLIDVIGKKPSEEEILHIATVALCMLVGIVPIPYGRQYIITFMNRYGYTEFSFMENGFIRIKIKNNMSSITTNYGVNLSPKS